MAREYGGLERAGEERLERGGGCNFFSLSFSSTFLLRLTSEHLFFSSISRYWHIVAAAHELKSHGDEVENSGDFHRFSPELLSPTLSNVNVWEWNPAPFHSPYPPFRPRPSAPLKCLYRQGESF